MTMSQPTFLCCSLLLCICQGTAHADQLDDDLQTVWESLWDQRGTAAMLRRWEKPILYRIHGVDAKRHREHLVTALKAVTEAASVEIVDVSAQADAETAATLDLEVVENTSLQDNEPCVTRSLKASNGALGNVQVKMRSQDVWRCAFHEMMHVMGISGHPSGRTVLSYFPYRRDSLMRLDHIMIAAWYSPAMPKNATPLEALVVLSAAVARQTDLGLPAGEAVSRAGAFNQRMLQQMEALATGQGEVPSIIHRSGKANHESIRQAQPMLAFFVGVAYFRGVIAPLNPAASTPWFKRAAEMGYLPAQLMWASALMNGTGVEVDRLAGHAWSSLAAKSGIPTAVDFHGRVEKTMRPEELEKARLQPLPQVNPL